MNVWQKRKCHNYRTFTRPRLPQKAAAKSSGSPAIEPNTTDGRTLWISDGKDVRIMREKVGTAERASDEAGRLGSHHVCKMGLEGIVSKRIGSRYRSAGEGSLHGY
jgi:hypothetical protein